MYQPSALLFTILSFATGLGVLAAAQGNTTLTFSNYYDDADLAVSSLACSSLAAKYPTLGSFPNFPNLGGFFGVSGADTSACGTCYYVTYGEVTLSVLAVDASGQGFTVSEEAMNALTLNEAANLGRVEVGYISAPAASCGL